MWKTIQRVPRNIGAPGWVFHVQFADCLKSRRKPFRNYETCSQAASSDFMMQLENVVGQAQERPLRNGIARNALMFPLTTRAIQKQLALVCDYLGYEGISTHSFRKWYATEIYRKNGYDIALVQRLLQHSSASTTQRYIGIEPQRIEKAIEGHAELI